MRVKGPAMGPVLADREPPPPKDELFDRGRNYLVSTPPLEW